MNLRNYNWNQLFLSDQFLNVEIPQKHYKTINI